MDFMVVSLTREHAVPTGTSQSAGFVAGAAALLLSRLMREGLGSAGKALLLKDLMLKSVDQNPGYRGMCSSQGRLNVTEAMTQLEHRLPELRAAALANPAVSAACLMTESGPVLRSQSTETKDLRWQGPRAWLREPRR
jgi:hypothetical protein